MEVPRIRLNEEEYSSIIRRRECTNVGVIGDTHLPFGIEGYLEFCIDTFKKYGCNTYVHIGDVMDFHNMSYHESDPDLHSAKDELEKAKDILKDWYTAFPELKICFGNHDLLPFRKAKTFGIPSQMLKSFGDILGAPKGWDFQFQHYIHDVLYTHGEGKNNPNALRKYAAESATNVVIGHAHSFAGTYHAANEGRAYWGMNVGCGIDRHKKAYAYGRNFQDKPVVGCGVVLENGKIPLFIPMDLGCKMKYKGSK